MSSYYIISSIYSLSYNSNIYILNFLNNFRYLNSNYSLNY